MSKDINSLFKEIYGDKLKDLVYRDNPLFENNKLEKIKARKCKLLNILHKEELEKYGRS